MSRSSMLKEGISRRDFLRAAAFGATAIVIKSAVAAPSARSATASQASSFKTKSMTFIHENSFVKAFDEFFQEKLVPRYFQETGIQISYELVSPGGVLTRLTAAAETNSGPEVSLIWLNWAFLLDEKLVDVTDIAEDIGRRYGGWYPAAKEIVFVKRKWRALPVGNVGQLMVYRTDWFDEVGAKNFPETWDELLEVGRKLKAKGHPFGFALGHAFGDNHGWLYPLLWSFGAREVEPAGKTVVLDSNETARAVDFARRFYQETMLPDVLGWLDVNNNRAFLGEQISCTNNASSILITAKKDFPKIGLVVGHALNPKGPTGQRFTMLNPFSHVAFTYAPDQAAAKHFLKWLMEEKQLSDWYASAEAFYAPLLHHYDNHPMWNTDPRQAPFREAVKTAHLPGWPGPPSRAMSESLAKYVINDMFAKACQGASTREVIATATAQLKQIYASVR